MDKYLALAVFGITTGALFGLLALGVVMIYRSTGILNLAHGAMAMGPAYVVYSLNRAGLPIAVAAVGGLVFAVVLGLAVERLMRPLRDKPILARVTMTIGVLLLVTSLFERFYTTDPRLAPSLFPAGGFKVPLLPVRVTVTQLGILVVALVLSALLAAFFKRSRLGIAMRAASENRDAATLMGVDPDLMASLAWGMGSALAGLAGILLSPVLNLQPFTLVLAAVPAFVAALLARLESMPGAVIGGIVVGVLYYELPELPVLESMESGARELGILLVAIAFLSLTADRLRMERA